MCFNSLFPYVIMDGDVLTHFETDYTKILKVATKAVSTSFSHYQMRFDLLGGIVSLNLEMAHQASKELCKKSPNK